MKLKLYASDTGKKNFQTDISYISHNAFAFSEKAITVFKDIFEQTGQFFPVKIESKRKAFYGFYSNKNVYDGKIINFEKSVWRQAEKGKIINKLILNNDFPKNDFLFTIFESPSYCYVTDKFKELVEKHDLKGFDLASLAHPKGCSREILVSD